MPIITTLTSGGAFSRRGAAAAELYSFTSATFTPGGRTGRTGPTLTQARNGLSGPEVNTWKNNTEFFNTLNGIQLWTVPQNGTYRIELAGARGGNSGNGSPSGGSGARFRVDVVLTKLTVLNMVMGQAGTPGISGRGGGGGGGTFIYEGSIGGSGLIAAAAGAGGADDTSQNGSSARSDFLPTSSGDGGTIQTHNGFGGTSGQGSGAGWLGDGTGSTYPGSRWTGGSAVDNGVGGWGGGGGDGDDGGAGGGFTGGSGTGGGGTGGSYYVGFTGITGGYTSSYAGSVSNFTWLGNNNSAGFLTITAL